MPLRSIGWRSNEAEYSVLRVKVHQPRFAIDVLPLSFLPPFHEDELLYSVVARYGRYRRAATHRINIELFGGKKLRFSHDIPLQISKLCESAGADLKLTGEDIVRQHTLLPYYTALREPGAYDLFRDRMLAGERIFREVKGSRTAVPWPDRLRYCPECDERNRRRYGVPIWLRRHQLVTSLVCLEHGGILLDSEVDVTLARERRYVAASEPRLDSQCIAFPWSDRAMAQYRAITAFGHAMLDSQTDPAGWRPCTDLRALAWKKGFFDGRRTAMAELIAEFEAQFGELLQLWPRLQSWEGRAGHWLRGMLLGSSYTKDPVCRALAQIFLEGHPDSAGGDPQRILDRALTHAPAKPQQITAAWAQAEDEAFARQMRLAADRLRRQVPPVRITQAIMIRTVPRLGSILRLHPLPLTQAALAAEAEDHFEFVRRRLRWMFKDADKRGETIKLTKILQQRLTKDTNLVREEWHRHYGSG